MSAGLEMEFRSENSSENTRNGFCYSCSFRGIPRSTEEPIVKLGTKRSGNTQKKIVLRNSQNNLTEWFARTSKVVKWFYFCSNVQKSEHFCLHGMIRNEIPKVFCSAEQPEFRRKKPNCSVYSVFRGIIFLSVIANPNCLSALTKRHNYSVQVKLDMQYLKYYESFSN